MDTIMPNRQSMDTDARAASKKLRDLARNWNRDDAVVRRVRRLGTARRRTLGDAMASEAVREELQVISGAQDAVANRVAILQAVSAAVVSILETCASDLEAIAEATGTLNARLEKQHSRR